MVRCDLGHLFTEYENNIRMIFGQFSSEYFFSSFPLFVKKNGKNSIKMLRRLKLTGK